MAKTKFCAGLSDISDSYMAMIFDQGMVLHDGENAYDGVVDCLKELRNRKKIILLMSNSPLREKDNKELLKKVGIGPSLYDRIFTVGEFIASGIEKRDAEPFKSMGKNMFSFHAGEPHGFLNGLDISTVDDVNDADFVLVTGWDVLSKPVPAYDTELRVIIKKGMKVVFAMPDSRALLSPNYFMGPGLLIRKLRDYGAVVYSVGKPYKPIFQAAISFLQEKEIFPGQTVMVGDTMAHDMVGAQMSEIDSCFVVSGMHAGAFRNVKGPADVDAALNILIAQYSMRPTYLVERVRWGKALPDRKHRRRLQPGERTDRRIRRRRLRRSSDED
ncbi:MAG: TIGR01459 family HAD-type hydrolase [Pseudobdellovibrionaceae bacterium]